MNKNLYQKLFDIHIIDESLEDNTPLIYIDRHLIHEVTSPQAFEGLKINNRIVRRPEKTFATMDHNVSTITRDINTSETMAKIQMKELIKNCNNFGIELYDLNHPNQGIVHVIGPEQGITLPGMTIVCGDSHTSTHGAFGALAFGIGTSEVEHVLATQTLKQNRSKSMQISLKGKISKFISSKDIALFIINKIGTSGAVGHVIEFCGPIIQMLSMEGRMTLCNMSIEMGAKSGLIAPDQTTFLYLKNRKYSPKKNLWKKAVKYWNTLYSEKNAFFDTIINLNISNIAPQVTWGTNPSQVVSIDQKIPKLEHFKDKTEKFSAEKALNYMGLEPGMKMTDILIDKVFIGSCTNSRIEDLRSAAHIIQGKKISKNIQAIVVPGSMPVKKLAEKEGLDKIFIKAGFEWRQPGCSMCLAMNEDRLQPGERCASTSNRNFEGRQGRNGRTHLLSPIMAAAAAITGHLTDVRSLF